MEMNKKAQIFILSSIALMTLFFVSYSIYASFNQRASVSARVKTMDSFVFSMEKDLGRQLYTSGFRIIFLAQDMIMRDSEYISNFGDFFEEAINNGTVGGEDSLVLNGATISNITNQIKERGERMNVVVDFSDINVSFGQDDPWNVFVSFEANFSIKDKSNLASWNKREEIRAYVEITNFEDPVYFVSTNGMVSRRISKTLYEGKYASGDDKTNLSLHVEGKYYANNSYAPSFLKRLEGDFSGDENGIESFVNIPELTAQGVTIHSDKSVVDYLYFKTLPDGEKVTGMPAWFCIDDGHKEKYQIS